MKKGLLHSTEQVMLDRDLLDFSKLVQELHTGYETPYKKVIATCCSIHVILIMVWYMQTYMGEEAFSRSYAILYVVFMWKIL